MAKMQIKYLVYLFIAMIISSFAFGANFLNAQEKPGIIIQDLSLLKNLDGKIVEQKMVKLKSGWSDKVECYKIKYLSDRLKVIGFLLKPKVEGTKFPVMIYNRGGNLDFGKISEGTLGYLSYLASNNYVVLASQYRGNDGGEGREEFGGRDVNDVLNLIPLARSLPFTAPDKIAMLGYSRGGMMTYLAIKRGAEIKAAAVVGGVIDIEQVYVERDESMKNVIKELVGMKESAWRERSVYYWPEKINVPLLILHGEEDWRVKVSQAKKLSEKLKELGREHELVIFPKGDHGLDTHREERNKKIFEWFAKYLQGVQ
jgi:dipeptidyl aminopeptidase/acylaminoacyl peptidase